MQKKGAIEFSMTTIIVVIIGVIILAIAIPWLTGTLRKAGDLTDVAFEEARTQLAGELGEGNNIIVSPSSIKLSSNEQVTVSVGCYNDASVEKPATLDGAGSGTNFEAIRSANPTGNVAPGSKTYWGLVIKSKPGVSGITNPEIMSLVINCNGVGETRPVTIVYE